MIRLTTATLAALCVASVVASQLGGTTGVGVMVGFLLGAGCTGLGALFQRHILATAPSRSLHAFVLAFVGKLAVVVVGALIFRYMDSVAVRVDWRAFLVAYAASVAILLPVGSLDAITVLRHKAADSNTPAKSEAGL